MRFHQIDINGKELKCVIDTKTSIQLEEKLGGKNLLAIITQSELPRLKDLITIFHSSLQKFHHNYTYDKTMELYDEFIEDGGVYTDLLEHIMKILEVSGFFKEVEEGQEM